MQRNYFFLPVLAVLLSLFFAPLPSHAQDLGATVSAPGVFSYQAPKGWTVKDASSSKYKVALDAPNNNFAANINVMMESISGGLDKYVETNKAVLQATTPLQHLKVIDEKAFTTTNGVAGVRLVVTDTVGTTDLEQIFYLFAGTGDTKFIVSATCLSGDADSYAPIFDASLKTFSPK